MQHSIFSFEKAVDGFISEQNYNLGMLDSALQKLSPIEILKRGYAKVEQNGNPVDKIEDVVLSSKLDIILSNGKIIADPKAVEERKWITNKQ